MKNYTTFDALIAQLNAISEQQVAIINHAGGHHIGIHHVGTLFPISVNESEFNFMYDTIVENNLQSGFELSTGTGISTIGNARAFKATGGHLISLDSYHEEMSQTSTAATPVGNYDDADRARIKAESKSYRFCNAIKEHEQLPLTLEVGWSPHDALKINQSRKLDFVFLDCPKSDEEFHRDFTALLPILNREKYFIFVHDTHTYTKASFDLAKEKLNVELKLISNFYPNTENARTWTYPLALITNT